MAVRRAKLAMLKQARANMMIPSHSWQRQGLVLKSKRARETYSKQGQSS